MQKIFILAFWFCSVSCFLYSDETLLKREMMESETVKKPEYLYKVLSYRHWQATEHRKTVTLSAEDDAFIHLSTEEQLDRIISKYWSTVLQFVVLKLATDKLEGELKYEANLGGSTKYYHLYQGFIPFRSIVEAKIMFGSPSAVCQEVLEVVQLGDPVLREPARELSKEEILSPEIQRLIEEMKGTMRAAPGVGLAAPQIGRALQLIVIEDMDHTHLTTEQISEREREKVPFHVVINPRMEIEEQEKVAFFEGCLSVPELIGIVPRAKSVKVQCLNERAEPVFIEAKGWYARILQHEIDHLNATLYIDRVILPTLMTEGNYMKQWKKKTIKEILKH